jgi:restriction system protein
MGNEKPEAASGAVFVRYFGPTLDALRTLGGSGTIKEVVNQIAQDLKIPANVQEVMLPSGSPRFQNQIQWARLYLVREGLLSNSKRGVWALTDAGQHAHLSPGNAQAIFKKQAEIFRQQRIEASQGHQVVAAGSEKLGKKESAGTLSIPGLDSDQDAAEVGQCGNYREEVLAILRSIKPDSFERFSQKLLREAGFTKVTVTGKSGDGGIDGYGTLR